MTPLRYLTGKPVFVNHGGLNEWEREKLSWVEKHWAKFNHRIAARFSTANIADNELYQKSLRENFGASSVVIRYGGDHVKQIPPSHPDFSKKYAFVSERYAVSVSRAQLDNNIHMVLDAFDDLDTWKVVIVSNWDVSSYGKALKEKFRNRDNIVLLDAIYDKDELDFVRGNAAVYIHSHSRCGTAPSLVEAMSLGQAIVSYDVPTNRETTDGHAFYFHDAASLRRVLQNLTADQIAENRKAMKAIARQHYRWEVIAQQYSQVMQARKPSAATLV
jgi:glycosyltransferase involved in cell wall biosynthesis